ncbi:MAG: cbb3-type cytochrome oxidase assembly protein CcoS [Bdellovibrionales bacterium]|nr:cbb3-type cytochrome oxidase assembly protein CcoS [Bdellovibrionales bacterium]
MNILMMTIPVTLLLVTLFIVFFLAAVKSDQFDDLETPAHGILLDDLTDNEENNNQEKKG